MKTNQSNTAMSEQLKALIIEVNKALERNIKTLEARLPTRETNVQAEPQHTYIESYY